MNRNANLNTFLALMFVAMFAALGLAPTASANPRNTLQPSNVYFGRVKSGTHPERVVTVANHTGSPQVIRRFLIAGAGGMKFTLVARKGATVATCHLGTLLADHASCTIIVRVKTATPEFWQSVIDVFYASSSTARVAGQWNGGVYADVIA